MRYADVFEDSDRLTRCCDSCIEAEQERTDCSEQSYTECIPDSHDECLLDNDTLEKETR